MYQLKDTHIDYILNDISARGVKMESLQQNLLDHICCIIEHDLEEQGDFENFYQMTIRTFYKDVLWEIEEETIFLLTFKNYYTMKKIMILSGIYSAAAMCLGIFFKFMHWPGASVCILLGILGSSLVFLPLLFTIKAREQHTTKEKVIIGLGTLAGILLSLSILFKVMHWPFANDMAVISLLIVGLLFLPIFFLTGIREPEKKVNTITISILVIMICGLWLTLIRSPRSSKLIDITDTTLFVTNEKILQTEQRQLQKSRVSDSTQSSSTDLGQRITTACQVLKDKLIFNVTGQQSISDDFESKNIFLKNQQGVSLFADAESAAQVNGLIAMIDEYNAFVLKKNGADLKPIPMRNSVVSDLNSPESGVLSIMNVLNGLSQVQMFVLQNERELLSMK